MKITGVEYYRLKAQMSVLELTRQSGIPSKTIHKMEKGLSITMSAQSYISVSKALGVTVDNLILGYDDSMLSAGDRPRCWQEEKSPTNIIANYKRKENLSLKQLGALLGLSREGARRVCMRNSVSDKYITCLTEAAGMSTREFLECYKLNCNEEAA